jgi:formylglycine-generating enzyme required for sulfatase activity
MAIKTEKVFKFIKIPVPIGVAGTLIWAAGHLLMEWDPQRYPDFKTIFETLPWMVVATGVAGLVILLYYLWEFFFWARIRILRGWLLFLSIREQVPANMVLVPEGWFRYGVQGNKQHLDKFFIDRYLVTNEKYAKFIEDTGHNPPPDWENGHPPNDKVRHPVTQVTFEDAKAFCKWRSEKENKEFSLPSEKQWEKACRGPFGLKYPWGNRFDESRCNAGIGPDGETNAIDFYPAGISPYGAYDMIGNVWEWTSDYYDPKSSVVVLRGGSYYFDTDYAVSFLRYHDPQTSKYPDLGFRCCINC